MSSYCSIEEAHGSDFYNQINNQLNNGVGRNDFNQSNPTRYNQYNFYEQNKINQLSGQHLDIQSSQQNISPVQNQILNKNKAQQQSNLDYNAHKNSFNSIGIPPMSQIKNVERAWGNNSVINDETENDPREILKKSLLRNRIVNNDEIVNSHYSNLNKSPYEPSGYSLDRIYGYKKVNKTPCDAFFEHLDSCSKCQKRLKKRVMRYIKTLEKFKNNKLMPNSMYHPDSELFIDKNDNENLIEYKNKNAERKEKNKKLEIENFSDYKKIKSEPAFLLFFGLFIIFMMDSSKNIFSTK